MPLTPHNTELFSLGKGILYIAEWVGTTPPAAVDTDIGNCPRMEVEVTEEKLEHYSSRASTKTRDKVVILEVGYDLSFDLDEIALVNLQRFLRATLSGTNVLLANTALSKEYALKFVSDNAAGPNETWEFWRLELSPGAAFNLISDEWSLLTFNGKGLSDVANHANSPYFNVTYATTTTTSSTTTTTA